MIECPICGTTQAANTLLCSKCGTYLVEDDYPVGTNSLWSGDINVWGVVEELEAEASPQVKGTDPLAIRLRIGEHAREVEATLNKAVHLGRLDPVNDVFPEIDLTHDNGPEKGVSRRHARILKRGGTVVVEDLASTNGTFINGKRLAPFLPEALHHGDRLHLGKLPISIEFKDKYVELVSDERERYIQGGVKRLFGLLEQEMYMPFRPGFDEIEFEHLSMETKEGLAFLAELTTSADREIAIQAIKANAEKSRNIALLVLGKLLKSSLEPPDQNTIAEATLAIRDVSGQRPLDGFRLLLQVTKPGQKYVHPLLYQTLAALMRQAENAALTSLEILVHTAGEHSAPLLYWMSREIDETAFSSFLDASSRLFSQTKNIKRKWIELLKSLSEGVASEELVLFYQTIFRLLNTQTILEMSAFELPILSLPDHVPLARVMSVLEQLVEISSLTHKSTLVDDTGDRLRYLAEARAVVDKIRGEMLPHLPQRERILCTEVLSRWREVISQVYESLRGRAILQVELLTKQAFPEQQVTLVLNIVNKGQALAENVSVTLEPGEDYDLIAGASRHLAGIPTKRTVQIEFTIQPRRNDQLRVEAAMVWDDPEHMRKKDRFADTLSLVEVKQEFTPISNPYVAGNPITSPKLFFGRQDVFDFVLENLVGAEQKNTLVFHGQRRAGKSSILLQLRERVLPHEFIPVYIDLEALPDIKTMPAFLVRMARAIDTAAQQRSFDEVQDTLPGRFHPFGGKYGIRSLKRLLFGLRKVFPKGDANSGISAASITFPLSPQWEAAFSERPATTFDHFLDTIEAAYTGKRFVVMFDEFELIEHKIAQGMDVGILNYFRSLMQHRNSLLFVFTGTHRLQEMTRDYWNIFFSAALNREISFLDEADTRCLITEPVKDQLEYDDLTVEKIIRVTRCQPYLVQLICWQMVNYLNGQKRNYATINDLNEVLEQTLITAEAYFNHIWEQCTSRDQRRLLTLVAALVYPGKETVTFDEVEQKLLDKRRPVISQELIDALNQLCRSGILEEYTDSELRYRFQIDLMRMWIEKNKPLNRVLIEEGIAPHPDTGESRVTRLLPDFES